MDNFKTGEEIEVSGEVYYGGTYFRVDSNGVVLDKGKKESLVLLDYVDGDSNVSVYVENKYIFLR